MVRMEETEEDVDFLPRRPVLERRKVERGVKGAGDRECRLLVGVAYVRFKTGCVCGPGCKVGLGGVFEVAGRGLGSFVPALELLFDF